MLEHFGCNACNLELRMFSWVGFVNAVSEAEAGRLGDGSKVDSRFRRKRPSWLGKQRTAHLTGQEGRNRPPSRLLFFVGEGGNQKLMMGGTRVTRCKKAGGGHDDGGRKRLNCICPSLIRVGEGTSLSLDILAQPRLSFGRQKPGRVTDGGMGPR